MAAGILSGMPRQPDRAGLPPPGVNHDALTSNACDCSGCLVYELNLCVGMNRRGVSRPDWGFDSSWLTSSAAHTIPARHTIIHPKESTDFVLIVCHGWVARSIVAPNGHRQILSFLLPGDLVSTVSLFEPHTGDSVDAITDVVYRKFKRSELKAALLECPALMEKLYAIWVEERTHADQLALNLGDKGSEKRIAWLILNLAKRLAGRGLVRGRKMDFPLRQRHIAHATGLTPVHVGKVLGKFQRAGLIEISDRTLRIVDEGNLHHTAGWL